MASDTDKRAAAIAAIEKAKEALRRVCQEQAGKLTMMIPARPDQDDDLVISDGLQKAKEALHALDSDGAAMLRELRERIMQGGPAPDLPEGQEWLSMSALEQLAGRGDVERVLLSRLRSIVAEIDRLLAAKPAPEPEPEGVPCPGRHVIVVDRERWAVAEGVKITADEALKRLGKEPSDHGVWLRDEGDGDQLLDGWRELSQFHTYFTAPRVINVGAPERTEPATNGIEYLSPTETRKMPAPFPPEPVDQAEPATDEARIAEWERSRRARRSRSQAGQPGMGTPTCPPQNCRAAAEQQLAAASKFHKGFVPEAEREGERGVLQTRLDELLRQDGNYGEGAIAGLRLAVIHLLRRALATSRKESSDGA